VLERANELEEAVRACQRTAKSDMKGAFAPKAIFTAARIMADRAGNAAGARAMYQFLVEKFPGDELAARAREALDRLR
jgi:TolA-binding protein